MSIIIISLSLLIVLITCLYFLSTPSNRNKGKLLPPALGAIPFLGNLLWLRKPILEFTPLLRELHQCLGPVLNLPLGMRPEIFISDRALAHEALVQLGPAFADRPAPVKANRFMTSNQHSISSAPYGPLHRTLRRNMVSGILQHHQIKLYADSRCFIIQDLTRRLYDQYQKNGGIVVLLGSLRFALYRLMLFMCFGEKLDEKAVREIQIVSQNVLLRALDLNVLIFFPAISKYIFRDRLKIAKETRLKLSELFMPLFEARRQHIRRKQLVNEDRNEPRLEFSYVDSLLTLELADDDGGRNRQLTEDEMVTLCAEFLGGGIDTTVSALQWIMAELVRHQEIQMKLREEIENVSGSLDGQGIKEEDMQKMPYLKAVILEGLRRHPSGHFLLPHSTYEDAKLNGYFIPKGSDVHFSTAMLGWDEKVWEEPMEFKPERFMGKVERAAMSMDIITGSDQEIKMMPFGAGRRMCPGIGLGMLHLEYFVANLVREFEWKPVEGKEVDMSEKLEVLIVMKHPLRARLLPRINN